jgi:hypothetical protein
MVEQLETHLFKNKLKKLFATDYLTIRLPKKLNFFFKARGFFSKIHNSKKKAFYFL